MSYAGDVTPKQAWSALQDNEAAVLVDVRTQAEWHFVGVPDLSSLDKELLFVEWQSFPDGAANPHFAQQLAAQGVRADQPIYFLCRSGARSAAAASLMTTQGFGSCFNISDGFEGPPDARRHRGTSAGWKAAGLPWQQN